jgi:hypothetical protein
LNVAHFYFPSQVWINNGSRDNRGRPAPLGTFEPEGIYCGMVGARFERYSRMESIFCFLDSDSDERNAWAPYGAKADPKDPRTKLMQLYECKATLQIQLCVLTFLGFLRWARFYGMKNDRFPTFKEASNG